MQGELLGANIVSSRHSNPQFPKKGGKEDACLRTEPDWRDWRLEALLGLLLQLLARLAAAGLLLFLKLRICASLLRCLRLVLEKTVCQLCCLQMIGGHYGMQLGQKAWTCVSSLSCALMFAHV